MKFKVWSNILFFIPLYLSLVNSIFWYSIIISFASFFSITFHYFNEREFKSIDTIGAIILIISNFALLFIGNLKMPYSFIAVYFSVVAIFFYKRQLKYGFDFNHGMWHIFLAATCYFSILTYLVK